MKTKRYIISGGGTGGHIYPAIAIANKIKEVEPNALVVFVGAMGKMEMEKVPQEGYKIHGLWITGIQRKQWWRNVWFPLQLWVSFLQASFLWLKYRPHVIVGTGGFASGPMLFVGNLLGSKTLIQEQNSYAGITNRLLGSKANVIAVSYAGMEKYFPKEKLVLTGNPVRENLLEVRANKKEALSFFKLNPSEKTVIVLGGSLGAQKVNEMIADHLPLFASLGYQLLWQCGKLYYDKYKDYASASVKVFPFVREMNHLYTAADVLISRAGAASISELCLVGKPVILIPSPNVAENHQFHNARSLELKDAALMIEEKDLNKVFKEVFTGLVASSEKQEILSKNIQKLAQPKATEEIVKHIEAIQ